MSLTLDEKKQFAGCYGTFVINGALALSIGALLPYIRASYGFDYTFQGILVSLHSVGNLLSSFLAGMLPLWIGKRQSMLFFSTFFAAAFLIVSLTGNPVLLAAAFLMTGLARGAVSNFNNVVINSIATGKAWALNTLHAMFSIGAFIAPLVILLCTGNNPENWRFVCYILIACGVIEILIYGTLPIHDNYPKKAKKTADKSDGNYGFFSDKQFWICTLTLFFYLCAEQGVIGWMVTYFKDSGLLSAGFAQVMASVLWLLILAGRLTVAKLSVRFNKSKLLGLMGIGCLVFFVIVMLGRSLPLITIGIAGFGFSMAGVYPTTVSLSGEAIKKYPLAWSFMLTLASFGSIIMPSIIGAVAESAGLYAGMLTIVIAVVVLLALITVNFIKHRGEAE
jgi:MFS transporter, FHS family, glucose/mannose:H+ symporter